MARPGDRRARDADDLPLGTRRRSGARTSSAAPATSGGGARRSAAASDRKDAASSGGGTARGKGRAVPRRRQFQGATVDRRLVARARAVGRRRWLAPVIVLGVAAVLGLGGYAVWFSSWLAVRHVEVVGAQGPLAEQLRARADVTLGVPMARTDLDAATRRVAGDRRVSSVTVSRRWPGTVRIEVTPRVAAMVVKNSQGQLEVADRGGVRFATVRSAPKGLQLITVKEGAASEERLAQVPPVLDALPDDLRKRLLAVAITGRSDVELSLPGMMVRWGDGARSADKAAALQALLKTPEAKTKDVVIDVSAPDAPAVLAPHAPRPATGRKT